MARDNQLSGDFTTGNIAVKLIAFMLPILGALVLQAMYGAVDLLVVGQFGTSAGISGVATGSNLINLVMFVIAALTMGVTVVISRFIGERHPERIGNVIGGAVWFFAIFSAVCMLILIPGAPLLTSWLNAPKEAFDLTVTYVRICGAGIVFVVAYNVISGIFRGLGNSKLPLIFVAIACAVNIVGDLFFVAVCHMNVAGAALATILAQAVSVILSLVIITHQDLPFSMQIKDIGWHEEIRLFLKTGIPIAFQEFLTNLSFLILVAIVNHIGLEASSGYGIAQKITAFVMLVPGALMQSMASFVGQNVGAGKEKRSRQSMFTGMAIGCFIGIFIFWLTFNHGEIPSAIFTSNPAYIVRAAEYLKGFAPEAVLTCIVFSYIGFFNGHEMTMPVMIQGITASFLVRVPLSYLFSIQPGATLVQIGMAVPIATVYGIVFFTIRYLFYVRAYRHRHDKARDICDEK